MSELTRRTLMGAVALTGAGAMVGAPPALAVPGRRTTIVVSPHPDDEWLRGAGYVNWATHRGDLMVLAAVTDGGSTYMGVREGLSHDAVAERRSAEQVGAWSSLTYGTGVIHRMGLIDGQITRDATLRGLRDLLALYPGAEVYAACHPLDTSADHIATWQACRDSGAAVVRYLKDPRQGGGATGTHYPVSTRAAQEALAAYWWTLGPRSTVGSLRNAMVASGYRSRYTR